MHRVERKIFSGVVLEVQKYVTERVRGSRNNGPTPRFKDPAERAEFMKRRSRRKLERIMNENFTPAGYYCTFTFDRDHECHTAAEANYQRGLFTRRLKRKYPDAKIISVIGKGKTTDRYHVHAVIEGVPQEYIEKQWTYGEVRRVEHLRAHNYYDGVDHGADYTALADYLFDHWTPDQGSHRWKSTRNMRQPEVEVTEEPAGPEDKRNYPDPGIPDTPEGYILVKAKATKYGFNSFLYVRDPKPDRQRKEKRRRKEERRQRKKEQALIR